MSDIHISQSVSIARPCCSHIERPFRGGRSGGDSAIVVAEVIVGTVVVVGRLAIGALGLVIRASGPVLYFVCSALCLVGETGKRLAPGLSSLGEGVTELAQLGSGD